jgi:hypothetical protein
VGVNQNLYYHHQVNNHLHLQINGYNYQMKNKKPIKIGVSLEPEILKKLEEGKFNKSKLVNYLLTDYFKK